MECSMVNYVYKYKTVIVWNHVIVAKLLKKYPKLSKIIKIIKIMKINPLDQAAPSLDSNTHLYNPPFHLN